MKLKYMNSLKTTVYLMSLWALFASCAKEVSESHDELEQRYIEAYMNVNAEKYPGATLSESGLYFLSHTRHTSGDMPKDDDMIYIRYTSLTLAGNIAETSVDSLARMLGTHSYTTYYGPKLFSVAEGATLAGLREAFLDMRTSDTVRILLPSKLSTSGLSDARLYDVPMIYDLELLRVEPDIAQFQVDSLAKYKTAHYPGATAIIVDSIYFKSLNEGS
ncbi:MAG: hypothetical protein LBF69_06225, partial [Prevotellaceae bacterium]|nr:hypothetical protein [Prevotellaceae bacterium]